MNKILIITTDGCEACNIAKENVLNAVLQASKTIQVETEDWHNLPRKFIVSEKIKDFPTAVYTKDGKVIHKAVGSFPAAVYLRWIDLHF